MTENLSEIRHQLAEEIQCLIKVKDKADNESDYIRLDEIITLKKEQFEIILENELSENEEEYQAALLSITESVNDVKAALEGITTMASVLDKSAKALRAVSSLIKMIT